MFADRLQVVTLFENYRHNTTHSYSKGNFEPFPKIDRNRLPNESKYSMYIICIFNTCILLQCITGLQREMDSLIKTVTILKKLRYPNKTIIENRQLCRDLWVIRNIPNEL